jgi:hypothetical protein
LVFFGAAPGFNTSLAFNFANPRITDELVRIAPAQKSTARFNSAKSCCRHLHAHLYVALPGFHPNTLEEFAIHSISLIAVPSHRLADGQYI